MANLKSDVEAKVAYAQQLKRRGYDRVAITKSPADVTAYRDDQVHYFEIKYTAQKLAYFGAATLTEWEAALKHRDRFRFVTASRNGTTWTFREYTPDQFMAFSYVPPFKIFFNVPVGDASPRKGRRKSRRIGLTSERLRRMSELFRALRALEIVTSASEAMQSAASAQPGRSASPSRRARRGKQRDV